MTNNIDLFGINPTVYDVINRTQYDLPYGQQSGGDFSNVLNGSLMDQTIQSVMTGLSGIGGPGSIPASYLPPGVDSLENALVSVADQGEMSGPQLMVFMMMMMMQSSENSSDMMPIMQVLAQLLSQMESKSSQPADNPLFLQNNMPMPRQWDMEPGIREMVDVALSQVGYQERNRDGSIGSGNFTQFGAWYGMDGQPWCAMFVSWAADRAGLLNDVVPRHASTAKGVAAYQEKGLYSPRNSGYIPREGDAIYFQNPSSGRVNHVGIVVAFDPATQRVYTVEGNTNNAVRIRHYDLSNPRIHGYGRNGGTGNGTIPVSSTSGNGASTV